MLIDCTEKQQIEIANVEKFFHLLAMTQDNSTRNIDRMQTVTINSKQPRYQVNQPLNADKDTRGM